jgi:hypothetical protein
MTLPDFLVIGAQKAGTTALHRYLSRHPEIYTAPAKETNFFALEGERLDFRGPRDMEVLKGSGFVTTITELSEYERQFAGVRGERAVGEVCPLYLYSERAAERIKRHVPEVRLIAVLRDPAERAYSSFLMLRRSGREPLEDFAAALEAEDRRVAGGWEYAWHYRRAGYYHEQLSRYYALFDPAQIRVYLYEDLDRDASGTLRDIFGFLGVDENHAVDTSERYNVSGVPRSRMLHELVMRPNRFKAALRPLLPARVRKRISAGVRRRNMERPALDPEIRRDLVAGYREDILRLEELIGRDLSGWLRA